MLALACSFASQVVTMTPDSPKFMNGDPRGASWKVFAVDSYDRGPIGVVQVEDLCGIFVGPMK